MISIFARKRDLRVREDILKGVYEDNLRIVGKLRDARLKKRYRPFSKTLLVIAIASVIVLFQGNYLLAPNIPERQLTASVSVPHITLDTLPPLSKDNAKPSDYRAMLGSPGVPLSRMFGLGVRTIMIDPGHGGADSGSTGKMGTKEKEMTLDIAKRLRDRLVKYGRFNVILTRDKDETVPLNRRVDLARSGKADIFISIHLNYIPSRPINIIETYYFGPSADKPTLKLAEQENSGSEYGLSDFRDMIGKIGETLKLQESREFAFSIQKSMFTNIKKETGDAYNFGVKRAPFVVLLGVDVPSVLAEVSCLSNKEEEMKLNTESHRENIAHYLESGILDYLNKGEARNDTKRYAER